MLLGISLSCQCAFLSVPRIWEKIVEGFFERPGFLAARLGVEPRQSESESLVLPLHNRAVKIGVQRRENVRENNANRSKHGAGDGIRTRNRLFTKQVLYH